MDDKPNVSGRVAVEVDDQDDRLKPKKIRHVVKKPLNRKKKKDGVQTYVAFERDSISRPNRST